MNNFEFISYKSFPQDQYTLGVATVRAYGKIILKFKHVKKKDGGTFFCSHQLQVMEDAEKKNIPSFLLDSRGDEEALMDMIREEVKRYSANAASITASVASIVQTGGGVADDGQLPF